MKRINTQNHSPRLDRLNESKCRFQPLLVALWVIPATLAVAQPAIPGTSRQHLNGHLTAEMRSAPVEGRVPPTTQLTLSIGLVIPNRSELIETARSIADPRSPAYRKYLTPEQFADRFGATPADYQSVVEWAKSNNLTVTTHRNRFVVNVEGSVADIEPALGVHLNNHLRGDGTVFFAPDAEPSLALPVPVEHIGGLDNFMVPTNAGGSGSGGTYQGTDFRNAYAPQMTLTGKGEKIGIFMLDGFAQSDINGYAKQTGQSFLPVQIVPAKTVLTPGKEGTLDIEASLSMAPAAQVVVFVGSPTTILTNMTDREDIKQFSSSWFWYSGTTTDVNLMLELGMHGQSFFQASGDSGAYIVGVFPKYVSGSLDCRQFPSITIVGGTVLNMTGNGTSYGSIETAWGNSGGGIEASVPIPPEQVWIAGVNGASSSNRNVPDVSAMANDINIFFKGASTNVNGTSEATPLWAGFMALVNELAASTGAPSIGYANPAFYATTVTGDYNANFHDVVTGCNPDKTGNSYCGGTGYDLVTGLGSPKNTLIYTLSGVKAFPLYCQGPLTTTTGTTYFKWASQGADAASPGPGECAWANRAPNGVEMSSNVIAGSLNKVANLAAGKFAEIGVYRDLTNLVVTQIVGLVTPPFSSSSTLP
ncbi:MAG TPA: S53 family peptidase [Bryobacteraceae bacterium]|nr:S53 family peptidase [Bryobacteraceae bacterium]